VAQNVTATNNNDPANTCAKYHRLKEGLSYLDLKYLLYSSGVMCRLCFLGNLAFRFLALSLRLSSGFLVVCLSLRFPSVFLVARLFSPSPSPFFFVFLVVPPVGVCSTMMQIYDTVGQRTWTATDLGLVETQTKFRMVPGRLW